MPSASKPDGSCLCGAVSFRLRAGSRPYFNVVCHCGNCKRTTGSAFGATNGIWLKDDVALDNERHALRIYADGATDSGVPLVRKFCGRCGSPLFATTALAPDIVSVYAGCLLDPDRVGFGPPFKEQYVDCKRAWEPALKDLMLASTHPRGCHTYPVEDIGKAREETAREMLEANARFMVEAGVPNGDNKIES